MKNIKGFLLGMLVMLLISATGTTDKIFHVKPVRPTNTYAKSYDSFTARDVSHDIVKDVNKLSKEGWVVKYMINYGSGYTSTVIYERY